MKPSPVKTLSGKETPILSFLNQQRTGTKTLLPLPSSADKSPGDEMRRMQQTLLAESSLQSPGGEWPSGSQGEDCEMRLALVLVPPLPQVHRPQRRAGAPSLLPAVPF